MEKEFFTSKELADLLRVHPSTLKNWRKLDRGCPYIKINRKILYKWSAVKKWLEDHSG